MGSIRNIKTIPMFVLIDPESKIPDFSGPNFEVVGGRTWISTAHASAWAFQNEVDRVDRLRVERVGDPPTQDEDAINAPPVDRSGGIDMELLDGQIEAACEHIPHEDGTSTLLSWIKEAIEHHGYVVIYDMDNKPDHAVL